MVDDRGTLPHGDEAPRTGAGANAYDAVAPMYEEYSRSRQAYLDAVDGLVIEQLRPGMRLLDIGAGDGRRLRKIRDEVGLVDVIAVEPSSEMAKACRMATGAEVHECFAEGLGDLDIGTFDVVTALWNVFGHIDSAGRRVRALEAIRTKLRPGGRLILDVNNRHNARSYGRLRVLSRVVVDRLAFDERRGDASYEWKIGDASFQARGHLFNAREMDGLFERARLEVIARRSVDYTTGQVSRSPFRGQLFYIVGVNETS